MGTWSLRESYLTKTERLAQHCNLRRSTRHGTKWPAASTALRATAAAAASLASQRQWCGGSPTKVKQTVLKEEQQTAALTNAVANFQLTLGKKTLCLRWNKHA